MTDDSTIQNIADGAGFAGLAIGLVAGLVFGTWVVVKIWRFAVREMRESVREDGKDGTGDGTT